MTFKNFIRDIPDFPIPGVLFRDISPLLESPKDFHAALEKMVVHVDLSKIQIVVGIESRGFILGAALASMYKKGFIPLRKAGKLPPPVEKVSYSLEYGTASLEMTPGTGSVLIVDDVLATGGTLQAGINLCGQAGFEVIDVCVLINLTFLNQMKFKDRLIHSVVTY